jgi:hypothetical protein
MDDRKCNFLKNGNERDAERIKSRREGFVAEVVTMTNEYTERNMEIYGDIWRYMEIYGDICL